MIQAMYSGISGMKAFKTSLDVIGNNIANVNTTAYKSQTASFQEMLTQTLSSGSAPTSSAGGKNASQLGLGVVVGAIKQNNAQGSKTATGNSTDLAVDGNGFFMLGSGDKVAYTRDGSFTLDAKYNLVSASSGMKVLGWQADLNTGVLDTSGAVTGSSDLQIPIGGLSVAKQTSNVTLSGNLDASAASGDSKTITFDVYDSLGLTHRMNMTFTKLAAAAGPPVIGANTWSYSVSCTDATVTPVTSGNIVFNNEGYSTLDSIPISMNFTGNNGSLQPLTATFNTQKLSQLNGSYTAGMSYQDGLALGTLEDFNIGSDGLITGTFTNGSSRTLGQIAMAGFNNPAGLTRDGGNLYSESSNSGNAIVGRAAEGSLGSVSSGYLEASNVDLANEFASMIVAQRGFQANSRIMTTADEVLQELVNLKR